MPKAKAARLGKGLKEIKPKPPTILRPSSAPSSVIAMAPPGQCLHGVAITEECDQCSSRPPVGHNNPPELVGIARLEARKQELVATASAWLNTFDVVKGRVIDTAENAAKLKGFKSQARELQKEVEAELKAARKPLQDQVKALGEEYAPLDIACELILDKIEPLLTDWLKRQQAEIDRIAREKREAAEAERRRAEQIAAEAQRQADQDLQSGNTMALAVEAELADRAAEKAEKAAAAVQSQRAKVGAEFRVDGVKRSASLVTVYAYEVIDPMKAFEALCAMHPTGRPQGIIEAIEATVKKLHGQDRSRTFPGIRIREDQVARG